MNSSIYLSSDKRICTRKSLFSCFEASPKPLSFTGKKIPNSEIPTTTTKISVDQIMPPRWKGEVCEAKALAEPMSVIVSRLRSSLIKSNSQGLLSGCSVLLLAAHSEQIELFNQSYFGRPVISEEKDKQWFHLSLEEALYLCSVMKCIELVGEDKRVKDDGELWRYVTSKRVGFAFRFKAYSHPRMKNWVVRAGSQYGVDFVAYRHHPALVHSEYAVIVLSDEGDGINARLKAWSDFHCTLRLCGNVAKTLLVLHVSRKESSGALSNSSLEDYCVGERTVTRWNPDRCRESRATTQKESV